MDRLLGYWSAIYFENGNEHGVEQVANACSTPHRLTRRYFFSTFGAVNSVVISASVSLSLPSLTSTTKATLLGVT